MAESGSAAAASEENERQITFNVKSSSDSKFVFTLPVSTTISDLKQKLSTPEHADVPPERQRLIYSGRVLKDHDTIATCKIKDGSTVHLVKGAASNSRQNPQNQGSAVPPGAGRPAGNVPQNIAAGTGAGDPLAQLTGARYAGFHNLPGADMFGADGGMGAPPNTDQMLRMLEDPNVASQMSEAMNNPAVLEMLRNNPLVRDNPMVRQAIENPELRRMMMNPDMIRMSMQMQRAMGGEGGGANAFPMPGQTDTTESNLTAPTGAPAPDNPFAALFPGNAGPTGGDANAQNQQPNPFASLMGAGTGPGGAAGGAGDNRNNPMASMMQQFMQNPQMAQQMMQMMGGGGAHNPAGPNAQQNHPLAGPNPFLFGGMPMGGVGGGAAAAPPDNRPPEERYEAQLQQLNDMGFYEFERNVQALRRSGGSVQGAIEFLLSGP